MREGRLAAGSGGKVKLRVGGQVMNDFQHGRAFSGAGDAALSRQNSQGPQIAGGLRVRIIVHTVGEYSNFDPRARSAEHASSRDCPMGGVPLRIHAACVGAAFVGPADGDHILRTGQGFKLSQRDQRTDGMELWEAVDGLPAALRHERQQFGCDVGIDIHQHLAAWLQLNVKLQLRRSRRERLTSLLFQRVNQLRLHLVLRRRPGGFFAEQSLNLAPCAFAETAGGRGEKVSGIAKQQSNNSDGDKHGR